MLAARVSRFLVAALIAASVLAVATVGALPVSGTTASIVDHSCDSAPASPVSFVLCQARNYARTTQAPVEEALNPAFLARWQAQSLGNAKEWAARAVKDPSWLSPKSGNTALLPVCATWAEQCTGDPFRYPDAPGPDGASFYATEGLVTPVVFYDRDCARISGHIWVPRSAAPRAKLPTIVITNGSLQAPETAYWWAAQAFVRAGYVVLTYDPRGQGRSEDRKSVV